MASEIYNESMRVQTAIGLAFLLVAGCVGRQKTSPMDAGTDAADAGDDTPAADTAPADATPRDTAADSMVSDLTTSDAPDTADAPDARDAADAADATVVADATDARDAAVADTGPDGAGSGDTRPADPCASNIPLSTVGCNGDPKGPAPPNTFGGRCSFTDAGAAGTCTNSSHFCVEGLCAPICERTAPTEVSTGGCPAGSRCWNTGILTFCFPDCHADADCATGICDTARGLCRGP